MVASSTYTFIKLTFLKVDGINDNKSKDNDVHDKFITTHCTCAVLPFENNECTSYANVFLKRDTSTKPDSKDKVVQLCDYVYVLITWAVARNLLIATKPRAILSLQEVAGINTNSNDKPNTKEKEKQTQEDDNYNAVWKRCSLQIVALYSILNQIQSLNLTNKYNLCLGGKPIEQLQYLVDKNNMKEELLGKLLLNIGVEVHARTSPVQKVFILSTLKKIRYYNINV